MYTEQQRKIIVGFDLLTYDELLELYRSEPRSWDDDIHREARSKLDDKWLALSEHGREESYRKDEWFNDKKGKRENWEKP